MLGCWVWTPRSRKLHDSKSVRKTWISSLPNIQSRGQSGQRGAWPARKWGGEANLLTLLLNIKDLSNHLNDFCCQKQQMPFSQMPLLLLVKLVTCCLLETRESSNLSAVLAVCQSALWWSGSVHPGHAHYWSVVGRTPVLWCEHPASECSLTQQPFTSFVRYWTSEA